MNRSHRTGGPRILTVFIWVSRAAEQGFNKAVVLWEALEGVMIPEQLSEAQRLEAKGFRIR